MTNDEGCKSISNAFLHTQSSMYFYPNPANDLLFLIIPGESGTLKLMDISGRIALEKSYYTYIDISDIASGVYFLKIKDNSGKMQMFELVID